MEAIDLEADWKEVAVLLNCVNEMLTEEIHKLSQENSSLQAKHKELQALSVIVKKGSLWNN